MGSLVSGGALTHYRQGAHRAVAAAERRSRTVYALLRRERECAIYLKLVDDYGPSVEAISDGVAVINDRFATYANFAKPVSGPPA